MLINNTQEFQHTIKNFTITLLSGEVISMPCIIEEDINEDREDYITIDLNSASYNHRLYEAFRNKELVECIVKTSTHRNMETHEDTERTFVYNKYFKIKSFGTYGSSTDRPSSYAITFQTV